MDSSPLSVLSSARDNAIQTPYPHSSSSPQGDNLDKVPAQFLWPAEDTVRALDELDEPLIDLGGFFRGDHESTLRAAKAIREACLSHGFFQVVNHGIDWGLIQAAHDHIRSFFRSPIETKLRASQKRNGYGGYSSAHSERFSSRLPWKETLSFGYPANSPEETVEFFKSKLGMEFEQTGKVYKKYCEAMKDLALGIMELLAISLGVGRLHYKELFNDSRSIMRCNYYPPCKKPSLVLGTGPHCDPTSLTVLHQDQVGGLEVSANGKWWKVRPHPDALVINIGDSFMALTNGMYKSGLHWAVVNESRERMSLSFFMCPAPYKVVRPPQGLLYRDMNGERKYPDFTWPELLHFVKNHHRADTGDTLGHFSRWLLSQSAVLSCQDPQA
ncbi:hypothetical protein CDL15_Pgr027923 [Punica granatum]|uniref:Fe2OG dioxygenase domain-containing protein n=2 Tax=Punica granatum TaxID=22663 RepID=A0A218XK99_PUNGR|nr:hypothetical protein CDL15_Pgr027923 [Punica granatum]